MKVVIRKLLFFFSTYRCYSRGSEDVNCFKVFALPVEAKAKTLKTLKLAFQSFAKAKTEMASFEMGVVGSSPTKVEPQEKHKKCYPKKRRTLYFQKRIE